MKDVCSTIGMGTKMGVIDTCKNIYLSHPSITRQAICSQANTPSRDSMTDVLQKQTLWRSSKMRLEIESETYLQAEFRTVVVNIPVSGRFDGHRTRQEKA